MKDTELHEAKKGILTEALKTYKGEILELIRQKVRKNKSLSGLNKAIVYAILSEI